MTLRVSACHDCGVGTVRADRLCRACLTARAGAPIADPQTLDRLAQLFVFSTSASPASTAERVQPPLVGAGNGAVGFGAQARRGEANPTATTRKKNGPTAGARNADRGTAPRTAAS